VRRNWRAFEEGDVSEALASSHHDFLATRVAPMPDVVPYHGRDGLMKMLSDWTADFSEFKLMAEEFVDANDEQVVVRIHQRAVGARSNVPVEADFWMVHTMRDAQMLRMDIYGSEAQALQAVGLAG
jgi:ketosteroid isomerase-like protein